MKKILASLGLILVFVLCCALVPVNATEACAHENFEGDPIYLAGQSAPTNCKESGIAKLTCKDCKETIYRRIVGKHNNVEVVSDATCTESQKVTLKCSVCGTVSGEENVGDPLGHDWKETHVDATCTQPAGVAAKCKVCGEEKDFAPYPESNKELYSPAKGHNFDETKAVKATCKEGGYTPCTVCGAKKEGSETEADTVNGHDYKLVSVLKEPGCTTPGIGKYACSLCETTTSYRPIPAACKWGDVVVTTPATCKEAGKGIQTCLVCGEEKEVEIEILEHTWAETVKDATCDEPQKVGKICTVCKTEGEDVTEIGEALGHKWDETFAEASCGKASGIKKVCSVCEKEVYEEFPEGHELYVKALEHEWEVKEEKPANCASVSYKLEVCKHCKEEKETEGTEKDPTVHVDKLIYTLKAPTCTVQGVGKYECELCKTPLGYKPLKPACSWGETVVTEAPTCAKAGKGTQTCTACGKTQEVVIPATEEHEWEEMVVATKCDEAPKVGKVCKLCQGLGEVKEIGKAPGHKYVETVIDATCTTAQKVGEVCTVCGEEGQVYPTGQDALGHDWEETVVDPTCDKPNGIVKVCKVCGEDVIEYFDEEHELYEAALGHDYEVVEETVATCIAVAYKLEVCKVCGEKVETEGDAKDPENHKLKVERVLLAETCTKDGVGKFSCEDCKADLGYKAIKAECKWGETVVTEAPTCAKAGKGTQTCTVCGKTQEVAVPATGEHTWVETIVDATCTTNGKVGNVCSVCKAEKDMEEVKDSALGHDYVEAHVDASCLSAAGIKTTCTRCDYSDFKAYTEEGLAEAQKPHEYEVKEEKEATCSAGYYKLEVCKSCGKKVEVKEEELNPDNHTEELVATLKAETCTVNGVGKYACKDCKVSLGYKSIPAKCKWGEVVVTEAPTCGTAGKGTQTCTVCGETKEVEVPATGEHDYVENVVDATCTTNAKVGKVCSVCKAEKDMEEVQDSALGHDLVETHVDASCESAAGVKFECSRCDYAEFQAYEGELAEEQLQHVYETKEDKAATCSAVAYKLEVCKLCGNKKETVGETKNPNNHTAELAVVLKEATCDKAGVGKYACKDCKVSLGYKAIDPACKWGEVVVTEAPTCGAAGKGTQTCTVCGETKEVEIKATGEHNYVENVVDATCTTNAKVGKVCTVCKAEKDMEEVKDSALGHDLVETHVDASCESAAGVKSVCTRCDYAEFKAYEGELAEAKKDHIYETKEDKAATCSAVAYKLEVCKLCGDKKETVGETKDPENHTAELAVVLKEATCDKAGVGKYACKDCKVSLGYKAIDPACKWGEVVVTEAPTCGTPGKGTQTCTVCGETKEVEIKATGEHNYVEGVIDATCTEDAQAGLICSVCDDMKDVQPVEDSALGHDYAETHVDASCENAAGVQFKCTRCEDSYFEAYTEGELVKPALEHNYEHKVVEGTCAAAGYEADVCANCGDVQNKVETGKVATNHTPKQDKIIKEATCTDKGIAKFVCADCGEALGYKAIAAAHTFGTDEKANAAGTAVYVECTVEGCKGIKIIAYLGTKDVVKGQVFESLAKLDELEAAK